jgi:hypothetical protein
MRHTESTRSFDYRPPSHVWVTGGGGRPCGGGGAIMAPLPVGLAGQPYLGMDPSAPTTWVRPWNPQPGMIAFLNFDGAKQQADTPMGGVYRTPQRDRWLPKRRWK